MINRIEKLPTAQSIGAAVRAEQLTIGGIRIRHSLAIGIFGNIVLAALVLAYLGMWVPRWLVIAAALLLALIGDWHFRARKAGLENLFREQCGKSAAAPDAFAPGERQRRWRRVIGAEALVPQAAIPAFILVIMLGFLVAADVNVAMQGWPLPLRWIGITAGATAAWGIFFALWASVNYMPAARTVDFQRILEERATLDERIAIEDRNDIQIIQQMSSLESLHRRIDAYTIESALLSALSFSAFITVTLAGNGNVEDLHALFPIAAEWHPMSERFAFLSSLYLTSYPTLPAGFFDSTPTLVGLITLCLLFCATTFLGVLVARLRFNDGYRDADIMLKTAQCLDDKEDRALEDAANRGRKDCQQQRARAKQLTGFIDHALRDATRLEEGLGSTMLYMRICRDTGIFSFVSALVLCGLFFTPYVSLLIVSLFGMALLIGYADHYLRAERTEEVLVDNVLLAVTGRQSARKTRRAR